MFGNFFTAAATWAGANLLWIKLSIMAGLLAASFAGGVHLQYLIERTRENERRIVAEENAAKVQTKLAATAEQIQNSVDSIRKGAGASRVKVKNEIDKNPSGFACVVPAAAIELLNNRK